MLAEALTALAAAGGVAVVEAAGTDAWAVVRTKVAIWFARGDADREQREAQRLEQTAAALQGTSEPEREQVRVRLEGLWQARFENLLESLNEPGRQQAANALRALLNEHTPATGSGMSAGRDVHISAEGGSIAAGVIYGGASIGHPPQPASYQG